METIYKPSSYYQAVEGCDLLDYGKIVALTFSANVRQALRQTKHLGIEIQQQVVKNEESNLILFLTSIESFEVILNSVIVSFKILNHTDTRFFQNLKKY
jgi:hypothetical protein